MDHVQFMRFVLFCFVFGLIYILKSLIFLTFDAVLVIYQAGAAPVLLKAEVPWSVKRGNLSEKERVLKTVKG